MPLQYPMVNGVRFDFSSVDLEFNGKIYKGVKGISYSEELAPGELRGNRAAMIGRTRGKYSAEGSMEMYKSEAQQLIEDLSAQGVGYMEASFQANVLYSEPSTPDLTKVDTLVGVRIKKAGDELQEGEEPATIKFDLSIMFISRNGATPINPAKVTV